MLRPNSRRQPKAAQDAHAEEHAAGQPDEDRGEHDAPARVAAVQRVLDVGLGQPDHDAARGERADHADDQPTDHLGPADELPAFPDRLGHRRRRDMRAELPFRDLAQRVDGHRGDHEGDRVEVQRQVHRVGGEVMREVAQRPADQRQQGEDEPGDGCGAERGEQAVLVGLLQLVRRHQVGYRGVLGQRPEQRHAGRHQLHHVDPGEGVDEMQRQVQRDGQVQHRAEHVANDHVQPPVHPVRDSAGQWAEDKGRQQRRQPDPAYGAVLGRGPRPGQRGRQRGQRDQAEPIPQAG